MRETHGFLVESHFIDRAPLHDLVSQFIDLVSPRAAQIGIEIEFHMHGLEHAWRQLLALEIFPPACPGLPSFDLAFGGGLGVGFTIAQFLQQT